MSSLGFDAAYFAVNPITHISQFQTMVRARGGGGAVPEDREGLSRRLLFVSPARPANNTHALVMVVVGRWPTWAVARSRQCAITL
jgi:hypothetical protein